MLDNNMVIDTNTIYNMWKCFYIAINLIHVLYFISVAF